MNIICFDTSAQSINIATQGDSGTFFSSFTSYNRRANSHASFLLPSIEYAVGQAGFKIQETQIIICPQGPGSFTGLRIAYSAAKAIQLQSNAKFYCVPVLEAIAFKYASGRSQVLAILDAKRDCFYTQLFVDAKAVFEPKDIPAKEIIKFADLNKKLTICGSGVEKFIDDISGIVNENNENMVNLIESDLASLSEIMLEYYNRGKLCIEVNDYDGPLYVRTSDAEK